ncbi:MAG TPA: 30S ribosomal protein S13 [Nautiliaceae bacterium]|nr:30S ribosomal protein S13 [Nautiliaceae bacterium]
MAKEVKDIVRIVEKDIDASLPAYYGLTKIKGVGWMFANAVLSALGIPKTKKLADLSEEEIQKIEDCIKNPKKYNIPSWLFNHRKERYTGEDKHYTGSDLDLKVELDIRRLKKIRAYRGIRHEMNLPVRGQSTRTHFKKMKGRGKKGVVVYKKEQQKK